IFSFYCFPVHLDLHSFPTRRSSDLFFLTGAIGLAWTIWWHFSYFVPVTPAEEERELQGFTSSSAKGLRWTSLLGIRETWGLVARSEEHTSELQLRSDLVCRLLLEKK